MKITKIIYFLGYILTFLYSNTTVKIDDQSIILLNFLYGYFSESMICRGSLQDLIGTLNLEKGKALKRMNCLRQAKILALNESFELTTASTVKQWTLDGQYFENIHCAHDMLTLCLWRSIYHANISIDGVALTRKNIATLCYLLSVADATFEIRDVSMTQIREALKFAEPQLKGQLKRLHHVGLLLPISKGRAAGGIFGKWKSTYTLNQRLIARICEHLKANADALDRCKKIPIELEGDPFDKIVITDVCGYQLRRLFDQSLEIKAAYPLFEDLLPTKAWSPVFESESSNLRRPHWNICSTIAASFADLIYKHIVNEDEDKNDDSHFEPLKFKLRVLDNNAIVKSCIDSFHARLSVRNLEEANLQLVRSRDFLFEIDGYTHQFIDFGIRLISTPTSASKGRTKDEVVNLFANMMFNIALEWVLTILRMPALTETKLAALVVDEIQDRLYAYTKPKITVNEAT